MQRLVNDWIKGFMQCNMQSESPRLYILWTAVSCIAAALQRKCHLEWGGHLTFYPNMYIVLIGPPGCRKGTAMGPGQKMLSRIGIKMAAESITREMLIRELLNATSIEDDPENNVVITHASLTIYSPELAVFLGYKNQQLIMDLTDWFDCRDKWIYRTKHQGEDEITGVWVNILGATTPHLIQQVMPLDVIGGGLAGRMIFVYETEKYQLSPYPIMTDAELQLWEALQMDLEKIAMMKGPFRPHADFIDFYKDWYIRQAAEKPFDDERFDGYFERRPMHLIKLAMIMSASRSDEMVIRLGDFENAMTLIEATEVKMPNTFRGVGQSRIADLLPRIMAFIEIRGEVSKHDLVRQFMRDADNITMHNVIMTLKEAGHISETTTDSGPVLKVKR